MQLAAVTPTKSPALASQTIDVRARMSPSGLVQTWSTERDYRLAGSHEGISTFTSIDDAIAAARQLSAGRMPGLAVMTWRAGYRLFDVHTQSRSYYDTSNTMGPAPVTIETKRSSVPFAAGNVRAADAGHHHSPAVVRDSALVALVDGARTFRPDPRSTWAGQPRLVEA
ncbi:MAG: hypothetical protein JWN72_743 [Thermoleophilia bacterium]|nr:hypothetical protein [Thermoleophilia bacterium]